MSQLSKSHKHKLLKQIQSTLLLKKFPRSCSCNCGKKLISLRKIAPFTSFTYLPDVRGTSNKIKRTGILNEIEVKEAINSFAPAIID